MVNLIPFVAKPTHYQALCQLVQLPVPSHFGAKREALGSGLLDEFVFGVSVCTHVIKDNLCPGRHVLRKLPGFIFRVGCFNELAIKRFLY